MIMRTITLLCFTSLFHHCVMDCISLYHWGNQKKFNALMTIQPSVPVDHWSIRLHFSRAIYVQSIWESKYTLLNETVLVIENESWNGQASFSRPVTAGFIARWQGVRTPTVYGSWISPSVPSHNCQSDHADSGGTVVTPSPSPSLEWGIITPSPSPSLEWGIINAFINGGSERYVSYGQEVTLDALTYSYDPEAPDAVLSFTWSCFDDTSGLLPGDPFSHFPTSLCSFTDVNDMTDGVISIPNSRLSIGNHTFRVMVQNANKYAAFDQKVIVTKEFAPKMAIKCVVNCGKSVLPNHKFSSKLRCENCAGIPGIKYQWSLQHHDGQGFVKLPTRSAADEPQECNSKADIILVYDTSGSIDAQEWKLVKEALINFATQLNIGEDQTRLAAVSFSTDAQMEFSFDTYSTRNDVLNAVSNLPYRTGKTNIAKALKVAKDILLSGNNRQDAKDIVVLFTDGKPSVDADQTTDNARLLKESADRVFAVGITPSIGQDLLKVIATSDQDVIHLGAFSDLTQGVNKLITELCTPNPVIKYLDKENLIVSEGLVPGNLYKATASLSCPSCAHNFSTEFQFHTHPPPEGGACSISPRAGIAFETPFHIMCTSWRSGNITGLDLPQLDLTYTITTKSVAGDEYILYHSASESSPGLFLAAGQHKHQYNISVTVQVTDEQGGVTSVTLLAQVTPNNNPYALTNLIQYKNNQPLNEILQIFAVAANSAFDTQVQNTVITGTSQLVQGGTINEFPLAVQASQIFSAATKDTKEVRDTVGQSTTALEILADILRSMVENQLYFSEYAAEAILPAVWNSMQATEPTIQVLELTPGSDDEVEFVRNIIGDEIVYASPREMTHYVDREVTVQRYLRLLEDFQAQQAVTRLISAQAIMADIMLRSLVIGEEPIILTTTQAVQCVAKFRVPDLDISLSTSAANITLIQSIADLTTDIIQFEATSYTHNHYTWSNSSNITSGIIDLKLTKENGQTFDLESDVIIEFPTYTNMTSQMVNITSKDTVTYMLTVTEDNAAMLVTLSSEDFPQFRYYLRKDQPPSLDEYLKTGTIETTLFNSTDEAAQLLLPSNHLDGTGVYFLTLMPLNYSADDTKSSNDRLSRVRRDVAYSGNETEEENPTTLGLRIATAACRAWDNANQSWSNGGHIVAEGTTFEKVKCLVKPSKKKSSFAISFVAPPASIDFKNVWVKFKNIRDNSAVFATVISMLLLWLLLLVVLVQVDRKDHQMWKAHLVEDKYGQDEKADLCHYYTLTVKTGLKWSAGTEANVHCQLYGKEGDSGVRMLHVKSETTFKTGSTRQFIMRTRKWLGPLCNLRIWHDNSAAEKSKWFLDHVIVEDHKLAVRSTFRCHNWLVADNKYATHVERCLYISTKKEITQFGFLFGEISNRKWRDNHLWVSVLLRPMHSNFTRAERVTCCFSTVFLSMLASATFFETDVDVKSPRMVQFGPFIFTAHEIWVSIISLLIVFPVNLIIIHIFRRVQRFSHNKEPAEGLDFVTLKGNNTSNPKGLDTLWKTADGRTRGDKQNIANNAPKQNKQPEQSGFKSNAKPKKEKTTDHKTSIANAPKDSKTTTSQSNNKSQNGKKLQSAVRSAMSLYNVFRTNQKQSGQQERRRRHRHRTLIRQEETSAMKNTNNNSNKVKKKDFPQSRRSSENLSKTPTSVVTVINENKKPQLTRPHTTGSAGRKINAESIDMTHTPKLKVNAWVDNHRKGEKQVEKVTKQKSSLKQNSAKTKSKHVAWVEPKMDFSDPKRSKGEMKEKKGHRKSRSNDHKLKLKSKKSAVENNNITTETAKPQITKVQPIENKDSGKLERVFGRVKKALLRPCPKWTLPIAWTLAVAINITSALFVTLYSLEWGDTLSKSWLKAYFLSLAESVLIADPSVVILSALFGAVMLYRARHRISLYDDDNANQKKSEEEERKIIEVKVKEEIINELLQETKEYARKTKAKDAFKRIVAFTGLLILVISIGYSTTDYNSYLVHNGLKSALTPTFFAKVRNPSTYLWWLRTYFIPNFFVTNDENGNPIPWEERLYMADRASLRIGPARLRQVRTQNGACTKDFFHRPCKPSYDRALENTQNFGPLVNITTEVMRLASFKAWQHQSQLQLDGLPYRGHRAIYSGGGYVADLDFSKNISLEIINELEDNLWFDSQTRAVFLEFAVYSANAHLFAYVTLLAEFPDSTGIIKSFSAHIMRTHVIDSSTIYYFICALLLIVYWFGFMVMNVRAVRKMGWKYIVSPDHWLNLLIIIIMMVVFITFIVRQAYLSDTLKQINIDKHQYIQFRTVMEANNIFQNSVAFLNLFVILKTIFILRVNRRLMAFLQTLQEGAKPVASFMVLLMILTLAYTFVFHLEYGPYIFDYHTIQRTWGTLISVGLGKFNVQELLHTDPRLTPWLFSTYMILMNWIFLSILVSVILDAHYSVMNRFDLEKDTYDLMGVFLEHFVLNESSSKKKNQTDEQDVQVST